MYSLHEHRSSTFTTWLEPFHRCSFWHHWSNEHFPNACCLISYLALFLLSKQFDFKDCGVPSFYCWSNLTLRTAVPSFYCRSNSTLRTAVLSFYCQSNSTLRTVVPSFYYWSDFTLRTVGYLLSIIELWVHTMCLRITHLKKLQGSDFSIFATWLKPPRNTKSTATKSCKEVEKKYCKRRPSKR